MIVFKEVEKRADIWMAANYFTFHPVLLNAKFVAEGIPGTSRWQDIVCSRDCRHNVDLYGYRAKLWMSLPAVSKNARLDDLLYDERRLQSPISMAAR